MKAIMYLIVMAGLLALTSCLKNNTASPTNSSILPTAEGDYWVYKVTDYQNNTIDTVTVSVVGSMKDPLHPENFIILQRKWPDKMDSIYISISSDTVTFYERSFSSPPPQFGYSMTNFIIYPLSMEQNFTIPFQDDDIYGSGYYDSVKMISSQSVEVNLNNAIHGFTAFQEEKSFLLPRMPPMPEFLIFTDNFVPGIGIIKETKIFRVGYANVQGTTSEIMDTWELLNCHINNPPSSSQ